MMFRQALADLKDRYPQRLQVIHLFSQESMDSDLLQGRIDGDKLRQLADHLLDFQPFRRGLYLRSGGDDGRGGSDVT